MSGRVSILETMTRVLPIVTRELPSAPDPSVLRKALWKTLNQGDHAGALDEAQSQALAWLEKASRPVSAFKDESLMSRSWAPERIERFTGIPAADTTLAQTLRRSVTREAAECVVAAYDPLWVRVPPRAAHQQRQLVATERTQALRRGCPPPLSDDDLVYLPDGDAEPGRKRSGRTAGRSADSSAAL